VQASDQRPEGLAQGLHIDFARSRRGQVQTAAPSQGRLRSGFVYTYRPVEHLDFNIIRHHDAKYEDHSHIGT
jgi:hypothetical protein